MLICFVLLAAPLAAQQNPASPGGRFQLFVATTDSIQPGKPQTVLYRIDTHTGRVWQFINVYVPETKRAVIGWTQVQELPSIRPSELPSVPPPLQQP